MTREMRDDGVVRSDDDPDKWREEWFDGSMETQEVAAEANDKERWDKRWEREGDQTWRGRVLANVYSRIAGLLPRGSRCMDLGGGVGVLGRVLREEREVHTIVCDHSPAALNIAQSAGLSVELHDFEAEWCDPPDELFAAIDDEAEWFIVSTECMEHLTERARNRLMEAAKRTRGALLSVPNDRLGPDEEPQHTIKFNAMSYKEYLLGYFDHVRIECIDGYLLAVCGEALAKKDFTLSVTMPVRDEAADLGRTLASFRGVADEIVVGVDPRTKDNTWEVAKKYADVVFELERPWGPPPGHDKDADVCPICKDRETKEPIRCIEHVDPAGVHFGYVRNQCIDRCSSEWIFMSEGHEHLATGQSQLLRLSTLMPEQARIGFVLRSGAGQQWGFPWLFKNAPDIRFIRHTHNALDYPEKTYAVNLPQIRTVHDRVHARAADRRDQRKVQNRKGLMDDWLARQSENSLFYLAQEWREYDPARAIERLEQYLSISNNGPMKYQARLVLAKHYYKTGRVEDAKQTLLDATADDWSRIEHFLWLGDIAQEAGEEEKAYQFYRYSATCMGRNPPFTIFWIDLHTYSYLPAQRLAANCASRGLLDEARLWAEKVVELLPDDVPAPVHEEAQANVGLLKEAIAHAGHASC